jgi:predicted RNA binding protein YcfA (HicA-like mRNA interferase family)
MKAREIVRAIERAGGWKARQSGGHAIYKAEAADGSVVSIIVPIHPSKEIPKGTVRSIRQQGAQAFGEDWV